MRQSTLLKTTLSAMGLVICSLALASYANAQVPDLPDEAQDLAVEAAVIKAEAEALQKLVPGVPATATSCSGDCECDKGQVCHHDCPSGDCTYECASGSTCAFRCAGGDCKAVCKGGATCAVSCAGGDCAMTCKSGATCSLDCPGGDCKSKCKGTAASCAITCAGDGCSCSGDKCP